MLISLPFSRQTDPIHGAKLINPGNCVSYVPNQSCIRLGAAKSCLRVCWSCSHGAGWWHWLCCNASSWLSELFCLAVMKLEWRERSRQPSGVLGETDVTQWIMDQSFKVVLPCIFDQKPAASGGKPAAHTMQQCVALVIHLLFHWEGPSSCGLIMYYPYR